MTKYSAIDWLRIGIANYYGHDKLSWDDRLIWFFMNEDYLEQMVDDADKYYLYNRAVKAYRDIKGGDKNSKVLMDLDACSSGAQLMSILVGCRTTATNTNVISNGKRNDLYSLAVDSMNTFLPQDKQIGIGTTFERDDVKKAVMVSLYGSKAAPKNLFGKGTIELEAFYKALDVVAPGAVELMDIILQCVDPSKLEYSYTMPDGYKVITPVMGSVVKKIEVPGVGSFKHAANVPCVKEYDVSLIANIVQSVEGYICREMIRRAKKQGFHILTIFDAFFASPAHMNKVRSNYTQILYEISCMDLMQSILREVTDNPKLVFTKTEDISMDILGSDYSLS